MATGVHAAGPSPAPAEAPCSPVSPLEAAGTDYERVRAARIRENMERMRKLGILDLAHTLTSSSLAAAAGGGTGRGRARRKPVEPGSDGPPPPKAKPALRSPARRSLRLKNVEPVSYCEIQPKKERDPQGVRTELLEEGAKEEIYTEEHEKLLGTCNTPWTLFVDGCDKDGKRIYDQVRGQTCHQCRQKTLGHHTSCCKCQIVQGQFCGDCLYMRYGENVLEAKKNPSWICPVCRGICNCSICRTKKGWFPTGSAYRKVVKLGYKSVAHYLIATQRASANPEDSSSADFSNKQLPDKSETSCVSDHDATAAKESLEDGETSSKAKQSKANRRQVKNSDGDKDDSRSESVVTSDAHNDQANNNVGCVTPSSKPTSRKRKYERSESGVTSESHNDQANKDAVCVTPSSKPTSRKRKYERSPDCIARRLRSPDCIASRLRSGSNKP